MKKLILILTSLFLFTACSDDKTEEIPQKTVRIVTSYGDFGEMVRDHVGPELQKRGYNFDLLETSNDLLPNQNVKDGSADANLFQHKPYLDEYNEQTKSNLSILVYVPTAPIAIYKAKAKSLDEVKIGSTVAIPSNVTNFARGLKILESLGWIELDPNADPILVTRKDITSNLKNIEIIPVEPAHAVRARADVDFAIIQGNFAQDAKIPDSDILRIEPGKVYVNAFVVDDKNKDTDWAKAIIEIVNDSKFKDYIANNFPSFYNLPAEWEIK